MYHYDSLILSIETSGDFCSAALSSKGKNITSTYIDRPRKQTSSLPFSINIMFESSGLLVRDCVAVAVSKGPGSYTGLRVGISLAKGLCFGADIPLIGIGTLDLIAHQALETYGGEKPDFVVPMIDARRMEVYQGIYDSEGKLAGQVSPAILDGNSYAELLAKGRVLFCGDGAAKFSQVLCNDNAVFFANKPDARYMSQLAYEKYLAGDFEEPAYVQPLYLKDFAVGKSKKKILG